MSDALIVCTDVHKAFAGTVALDGFDLAVPHGRILSLLGPSGCGKTTALRIIAGFEYPDRGRVEIGGRVVAAGGGTWVRPEHRRVGMVFQEYALFPHMSVGRNIGFGLDDDPGRDRRVSEVMELVGLAGYQDRMPHELSGGEQQRVALARALAPRPEVVLLDEPFSNLDAPQRERVRREVRTILLEARTTAVFVTHDQEEALATSDEVAVMREGTILQVAAPHDLYHHPVNGWVARFLGEGEVIAGTARGETVETALGVFGLQTPMHGPVDVVVRPEVVRLTASPQGSAVVVDQEFYGHDQLVTLEMPGGRLQSRIGPSPVLLPGDRVEVEVGEVVAFAAEAPGPTQPS